MARTINTSVPRCFCRSYSACKTRTAVARTGVSQHRFPHPPLCLSPILGSIYLVSALKEILDLLNPVSVESHFQVTGSGMCARWLSHVRLRDLKDCSPQAPLSIGFSRQEYCSGSPLPPPWGSSQPKDRTQASHIAGEFFTVWATGKRDSGAGTLLDSGHWDTGDNFQRMSGSSFVREVPGKELLGSRKYTGQHAASHRLGPRDGAVTRGQQGTGGRRTASGGIFEPPDQMLPQEWRSSRCLN